MLKCSHGLAYEVKCSECFAEAMARVKTAAVQKPVSDSKVAGALVLFQKPIDVKSVTT